MAGGEREMQVDHFDPTLSASLRHRYSNLMLSTGHCNNQKNRFWPTLQEKRAGIRFLNPTREMDYGEHIFEDPETFELIGVTRAGRYHIDILDLNHDTFVFERKKRAEYIRLKRSAPALLHGQFAELQEMLGFIEDLMEIFIPEIPPPPLAPYSKVASANSGNPPNVPTD